MKILKRGQIAIISVALMLVTAGYLEYKYGPSEETLGANIYISDKDAFMYQNDIQKANAEVTTSKKEESSSNTVSTNYSLDKYRLEREKTDSELLDNYKQIMNATNATDTQKEEAQKKLDKILNDKKVISVVEVVLRTDVIEDIVIMITNSNVSVIVSSKEELKKEQVNQIQTVIQKELNVKASQISIMRK